MPVIVPLDTKIKIRRDFILGKGTKTSLGKTYGVCPKSIQAWSDSENWTAARALFADNDDLMVAKQQLVELDAQISKEKHAEAKLQLVKCKQAIMEIFMTLAGLPRRPIGKLEKPKSNLLFERIEAAAKRQDQENTLVREQVINLACGPDTTTGSVASNCGVEQKPQDEEKPVNIEDLEQS